MLDVMMIDDRQNLLRIQQRRSVMCTNTELLPVNPKYKARIFELLYQDKKELLDLYNAVNGTSYEDPEELEITVSIQDGSEHTRKKCRLKRQWKEQSQNVSERGFWLIF